jgi:hypothetical protein
MYKDSPYLELWFGGDRTNIVVKGAPRRKPPDSSAGETRSLGKRGPQQIAQNDDGTEEGEILQLAAMGKNPLLVERALPVVPPMAMGTVPVLVLVGFR